MPDPKHFQDPIEKPLESCLIISSFAVRRNMGSAPSHWRAGSGSVARKALQSLESLKWVEKDANGGRRMSSQGRRDLDRIAAQLKNAKKQ